MLGAVETYRFVQKYASMNYVLLYSYSNGHNDVHAICSLVLFPLSVNMADVC
jgi:hypothetical protein